MVVAIDMIYFVACFLKIGIGVRNNLTNGIWVLLDLHCLFEVVCHVLEEFSNCRHHQTITQPAC